MSPVAIESRQSAAAPGRIGIWIFLASEIMFFMGLIGSYVLFRYADPMLFATQGAVMNKWVGAANTLVLLSSSMTMAMSVAAAANQRRRKLITCLGISILLAAGFLGIKGWEYYTKLTHYTVVAHAPNGKMMLYDGHVNWEGSTLHLFGYAAPMPDQSSWDIHLATQQQVRDMGSGVEKEFDIPAKSIVDQINDGPWKNLFFGCYFLLTAVHAVHVLAAIIVGMILVILTLRKKVFPAATEYIAVYWHFIDFVWIFLFVLLYLT